MYTINVSTNLVINLQVVLLLLFSVMLNWVIDSFSFTTENNFKY